MLNKEVTENLKKAIKDINKEPDLENRITFMINLKNGIRNEINEYLDDLFAEVNLIPKKTILQEEKYL